MDEIGPKLVKFRKRKKFSQEDLAVMAGVSQATVSRLEKQEQVPNIGTLAKLAKALSVDLSELAPPEALRTGEFDDESFSAFCDNPFCSRNKFVRMEDGQPGITWESWQQYRNDAWGEVNFCRSCGTDLVKECPSCSKRLEKGARFCVRCGKRITVRPTEAEWKRIEERLKAKEEAEKDIPF